MGYKKVILNRHGELMSVEEVLRNEQRLGRWHQWLETNSYLSFFILPYLNEHKKCELYFKALAILEEWSDGLKGAPEYFKNPRTRVSHTDSLVALGNHLQTHNDFLASAALFEISVFLLKTSLVDLPFEKTGDWFLLNPEKKHENNPMTASAYDSDQLKKLLADARELGLLTALTYKQVIAEIDQNEPVIHDIIEEISNEDRDSDPIDNPVKKTAKKICFKFLKDKMPEYYKFAFRMQYLLKNSAPNFIKDQDMSMRSLELLGQSFLVELKSDTLRVQLDGLPTPKELDKNFREEYNLVIQNIERNRPSNISTDVSFQNMKQWVLN